MRLAVEKLNKSFGKKHVLKDVSFAAESGSALGLIGRNGSGKTTVTRLSDISVIGYYVNADDLKKQHNLSDLEAAQMADTIRNSLVDQRADFTFETVLSTERNLLLLQRSKECGYEVRCIYVFTRNPDINIARVKMRVLAGGHDVPEDKIRTRYYRALELLPRLIELCDKIDIYDNSVSPVRVISKRGKTLKFFPTSFWDEKGLKKLVGLPHQS